MKVLHVTDTYWPTLGGIEVMVDHLARGQLERGHEVKVLTRTPSRIDQHGPSVPQVCREPHALPAGTRLRGLLDWADVVHVHLSLVSPLALRAAHEASLRHLPVLASVHSMWNGGESVMGGFGRLVGWSRRPILWAPVSRAAGDSVRRALGEGVEVCVLPNAIDLAHWAPQTPLPAHGIGLLSVGRMAMRKRPLPVVTMLAQLRRRVPSEVALRAVLVGEGPQRSHAERLVRSLGMDDWVSLPGALTPDEVRQVQRSSEVFIGASKLESFGLAALEARTAGLAVVGRSGTGIEEFVTCGLDGLLCPSDEAMVDGLVRLCTNDQLRREIIDHNRRVTPDFGWDDLLQRTDDAYLRAIALATTRSL